MTLSAEERQIGGLGIYMVKKSMDNVSYEHKDGQNIFTIKKPLNKTAASRDLLMHELPAVEDLIRTLDEESERKAFQR